MRQFIASTTAAATATGQPNSANAPSASTSTALANGSDARLSFLPTVPRAALQDDLRRLLASRQQMQEPTPPSRHQAPIPQERRPVPRKAAVTDPADHVAFQQGLIKARLICMFCLGANEPHDHILTSCRFEHDAEFDALHPDNDLACPTCLFPSRLCKRDHLVTGFATYGVVRNFFCGVASSASPASKNVASLLDRLGLDADTLGVERPNADTPFPPSWLSPVQRVVGEPAEWRAFVLFQLAVMNL